MLRSQLRLHSSCRKNHQQTGRDSAQPKQLVTTRSPSPVVKTMTSVWARSHQFDLPEAYSSSRSPTSGECSSAIPSSSRIPVTATTAGIFSTIQKKSRPRTGLSIYVPAQAVALTRQTSTVPGQFTVRPITRWHSTIVAIEEIEPFANPTAREACGFPMRSASSP